MAKEIKKRPKLRFPEFTDDWEQRKLSELTDRIIVGLATSVTPYYRETGTPLLRNMNIKENYLDDSDILYLDNEYANSNTGKMIYENDVLTVHTGSNIGLTCVAPKKYNGSLSFTTLITTPIKEKLDSLFLMQYMNCNIGKKRIDVLITAGGKPNLNSGDLEKLEVSYPILDEQKKIGEYFSNLDNLITLRQRELDELKELKLGMLQKMFPKNGADVPEIRFPEFTDTWEQRKLGDITEFVTGKSFSSELLDDGSYTVMDMGAVSQEGHRIETKRTNTYRDMLRKDDLIMPKDDIGGGLIIGRTAYIPCDNKFVLGDHVYRLRFSNENGLFVHYQINSHGFRKQILPLVTGSAQLGLNSKSIQGVYIRIPSYSEQVKIGSYFQNLDNLIALQQKELDGYKELKKGLLQQMFC